MRRTLLLLIVASLTGTARSAEPPPPAGDFDVVIYGGTSAGIAAGVQTRRMGRTAVVIEPRPHVGGMSTSGLGWTDTGNKSVIGGLSREFYRAIKSKYDEPDRWKYERAEDYRNYRPDDDAMWTFEPHVAAEVYAEWIRAAELPVLTSLEVKAVSKEGTQITGLLLSDGRVITGRRFIDATYEGDLLALAGVSSTVGREANATYSETLNGVQKARAVSHQFVRQVDPYLVRGNPASGLLEGINTAPGEDGAADHRLQAYNYRLCITDVAANRIPFAKPEGYDEAQYELLLRNFEAGDQRLPLAFGMVPNRKTDVNNNHAVSTDWIGMNYDYPTAHAADRADFERRLKRYTQGLLWTLANHPRAPAEIRTKVGQWGWAKDEWTDNDHWPYWPYVREGRRMVSDYVHAEQDCRRLRDCPDPVGMGSYNMDSHNCQRYVDEHGFVRNEGDIQVSPRGPYLIAYRAIVPRRTECTNLLVPVCLSCSHIAYGSIRMEPVFMILAQSAATAACLTIDAGIPVQDLDYATLRARLDADKQVLTIPAGSVQPAHPGVDQKSLPGVVIDDLAAERTGDWSESDSIGPYIGRGYLHDGNEAQGTKQLTFTAKLPAAGRYDVRLAYTANANRAANVTVTVDGGDRPATVQVNQRRQPPIDRQFISLGVFTFSADRPARVVVSNQEANGYVVADAVQFLPVQE